jgi:16S rRNA (guanine527-N7)-methyltransferase
MLDAARITTLLQPFVADVSPELAAQLQTYLTLLLRWNNRMNLTAVRDPEQIVTRHFGESLFVARVLRQAGALEGEAPTLADIGSGAGFPGIPIKLFASALHVTLIESQNKKATFLREVIRALGMSHIVVHGGRAESWGRQAGVVTLRAVEKFDAILPIAAAAVAPGGILALLITGAQTKAAGTLLGDGWTPDPSRPIPQSAERTLWLARRGRVLVGKAADNK